MISALKKAFARLLDLNLYVCFDFVPADFLGGEGGRGGGDDGGGRLWLSACNPTRIHVNR